MNVIFLDLDGPVFPDVIIQYDPNNRTKYPGDPDLVDHVTYWKMCERFACLWQYINNVHDYRVVISSAWRKCVGFKGRKESFIDLFAANELDIHMHDDWHTIEWSSDSDLGLYYSSGYKFSCHRADEIHEWLQRHPEVKNFLIIDDPQSGFSLDHIENKHEFNPAHDYMKKNIVLVNPDVGLGSIDIRQIHGILRTWTL